MNLEELEELEKERDLRRAVGTRLAFDCYHLKVVEDRVFCAKGKHLGQAKDGSLALSLVLKGLTPKVCKTCEWFEDETNEEMNNGSKV